MDFNMKQWRDQQQLQLHQQNSEDEQQHQHYSKIPRQVFFDSSHYQTTATAAATATVLPLFDSQPNKTTTHLSDFYCSNPTPGFKKMNGGGYWFSIEQWQELEVQALIFRHMMSGTAIPSELLQLVKKSLLTSSSSPFYFQPPTFLQGGYWGLGKGAMDPEPGRCRRTDGKKWRCSRDVVTGHKYCERHMHRGRNRSRKPVELSSSTGVNSGGLAGGSTIKSTTTGGSIGSLGTRDGGEIHFSFSNAQAQLSHGTSNTKHDTHNRDEKSNKVLMQFFDDWPTSLPESSTNVNDSSTTRTLTMSATTGNPSSDFLRLSTGNGDELGPQRAESGWSVQWGTNPVGSMGGPLAEALRSSTNSSPTSVLH